MSDYHTKALNAALGRLTGSAFLCRAVDRLQARSSTINQELNESVLAGVPAFSESRNPDILPELERHGFEHTTEILRLLAGGSVQAFGFVQEHARRRAEQRFPLEATLHAYRCGHKVFARWIREAVLASVSVKDDVQEAVTAVADFTMEYTDAISTIAAGAYLAQTRLLADVAGDRRANLLNILLGGHDESDGRVVKVLRDAGLLENRLSFCVVLAVPVEAAEMLNPMRARRLADSVDKILRRLPCRRLVDIRENRVTIVLSEVCRTSGWTVPRAALARRVTAELATAGNSVLIGISNDVPSTSQIPAAHGEALLALELADVGNRVVQIADVSPRRLLLHLAAARFDQVAPAWTQGLFQADRKTAGSLLETLRAYADADMNVLQTAARLAVHPNTVYSRLHKIFDVTGLDPKSYHALTELLIVADARAQQDEGRGISS